MGKESTPRQGAPHWKVHPGEILREEFLKPLRMSAYEQAQRLRVPAPSVNDIVLERRGISADTAVRLSRFFGTTEQFWLNLQGAYEISQVRADQAAEIERIEPRAAAASRPPPPATATRNCELLPPLSPRPLRHDSGRDPSPRTKIPLHFGPHRLRPAHHIFQHAIHNVLLKNPQVAVRLQIFLVRFQ